AANHEVRKHNDIAYAYWNEGKRNTFYYLRGPVLVLTHQEDLLRRVIDLDQQAPARADPAMIRQLKRLGVDRSLATFWINPRVFDAEVEQKATQAGGAEALVRKTILLYWKALEGVVLSASVQKAELELGLAFLVHEDRLPVAAQKLLFKAAKPSELWDRFPENALLTVAGRV